MKFIPASYWFIGWLVNCVLGHSTVALAQNFNLARAAAAGPFCPVTSTSLRAEGKKLFLGFTQSHLELIAGQSPLAALAACKIVIPISVPKGQFISRVTQRIRLKVSKSPDVDAQIAFVLGYNASLTLKSQASFPVGETRSGNYVLYNTFENSDVLGWKEEMCANTNTPEGIFSESLAVSAVRKNINDVVIFDLNGNESGVEVWFEVASCT